MAESPAHRLGQIVGEILEAAILPALEEFAKKHHLYLDKKGPRPCRPGLKSRWKDLNGNEHDLDYVLERGGTTGQFGVPAAFIETAWRRYTKHSRNKAQEIQGAIVPLAEKFKDASPFKGAILAGVFTEGALRQLRSLGFTVLFFPYDTTIAVFRKFGADVDYDDKTSDKDVLKKVRTFDKLSTKVRNDTASALLKANEKQLASFIHALEKVVTRLIKRILVLPLHGQAYEVATVKDALKFIENYTENKGAHLFVRYEIQVTYDNGDHIVANFRNKSAAVDFLRTFLPVP
jgi:hypothetical protein